MFDLGQFVKTKRKELGLSQDKLAKASGVSDSTIKRIEDGSRKTPNWENLCKIARALQTHPFEILLKAGYIEPSDIQPDMKLHGLESLSDSEIGTVQLFVDFLNSRRLAGGAGEDGGI